MAFDEDFMDFFDTDDFAVDATHTPIDGGDSQTVQIIPKPRLSEFPQYNLESQVIDTSRIFVCSFDQVGIPDIGDIFTIDGSDYTVEGIIASDDFMVEFVCSE